MSGSTPSTRDTLRSDLQRHADRLNAGCLRTFGVTVAVFRTAKFLFHIATLLFATYLIELTTISTPVAVAVAILLISGPEGLEAYLVRQGILADATGAREANPEDDD